MVQAMSCPCGLARSYAQCCGPLHRGERRAGAAEELMRSRYSAYALGEVKYLVETLHPTRRAALDQQALARSAREIKWLGLVILASEGGTCFDTRGVVEFEARYAAGANVGVLHERSRFERVDGAWYYVDGEGSERTEPKRAAGRNTLCACGSGRKVKHCCRGGLA